jgi:hypothetical protein
MSYTIHNVEDAMSVKVTFEIPDHMLRGLEMLSGYVKGENQIFQIRHYLLALAEEGLATRLAWERAFNAGRPSIVVNCAVLTEEQVDAICAALIRYGHALKEGEMGPIDELRSIIGR